MEDTLKYLLGWIVIFKFGNSCIGDEFPNTRFCELKHHLKDWHPRNAKGYFCNFFRLISINDLLVILCI